MTRAIGRGAIGALAAGLVVLTVAACGGSTPIRSCSTTASIPS